MNMKIGTVVAIVVVTVFLFGGGFALGLFTRGNTSNAAAVYGTCGSSYGMMGGWNRSMPYGNGMYGWNRSMPYGYGMYSANGSALCPALSLQDESLDAAAEKLGLSSEELENRLAEGESLWDVASEQGLSDSESFNWMHELMDERLDQAVESGFLTQEQAEAMDERMDLMEESGLAGGTGCWSGRGGMRGWVR